MNSIYDEVEKQGIAEEMQSLANGGDISSLEDKLEDWAEQITSTDEDVYTRKRIIRQEELTYIPASLQYIVEDESETFAQVDGKYKDTVSFTVGEELLASYPASDLAGKNILLSYRPATSSDEEILNAYGSVFNAPAHSVYMKPVLLVDGEVVSEGEEIYATTLGTKQDFRMVLHSGNSDTTVDNDVTTGSMYAVTLDNQNISPSELQNIYDETAALKDSVSEDNVYSEEYLGKLLSLAGKLYFAQVDITDIMAAEIYDVSSVRSLSEGITGYEVKTSSTYGLVTKLSYGSLYIDVDTDSHSVVSLNGEEDTPREYMMSTGMIGSLYESTVWEEITGEESVSTISILAKASEEDIDILLISGANLDTEIEKLNTDEATKQEVINAVNSGKVVTIPAKNITMGDWHGTGYIVTNPETGAGAYMISGGLNGGALTVVLTVAVLCACFASVTATAMLVWAAIQFFAAVITPFILVAGPILLALITFIIIDMNRNMLTDYMDYLFTGNLDSADRAAAMARKLGFISLSEVYAAGKLTSLAQTMYAEYARIATNNPSSFEVVLGKYDSGGVSYVKVAEERGATYFQLDNWSEVQFIIGKENMWNINEQFLEQQLAQGKTFILSHNPLFADGYYLQEIEFLKAHGYHFIEYGELWKAIIG